MNPFSMLSLLSQPLKSDEVIDLLELHDVKVVYDFDRLHEDTPDVYWASCQDAGFELRFDEAQQLDTIFMYAMPRDDFQPIDPDHAGVPFHPSFAEAQAAFEADGIPFSTSESGEGWIKGDFDTHAVHYEFDEDGALSLVTVMAVDA